MGVGKSAIGRRLAAEPSMKFMDSDTCIEKAKGKSVAEIFETEERLAFASTSVRLLIRGIRMGVAWFPAVAVWLFNRG